MGWVLLGPTGKRAKIPPGETTQLGRGPLLELKDKKSSRRECDVTDQGDSLVLCPKRDKFMLLRKEGGKETAVQQDVEYALGDGDKICFPQDNWYTVLFEGVLNRNKQPIKTQQIPRTSQDEESEAANVIDPPKNPKPAAIKKKQISPAHRPSRAAARKVRTYQEEDEEEEEEEEEEDAPKKKKRRRMDSDSGKDSASGDDEYKPTEADDGDEDDEEFMDDEGPVDDEDDDLRPLCKYGINCYRRSPDHLRDFRHPHLEKGTRDRSEDDEDEDEDVVDWNEDEDEGSEDEDGRESRKRGGGVGRGKGGRQKRKTADDSSAKKNPNKRAKMTQSPPPVSSPPKHRPRKQDPASPKITDQNADMNTTSPPPPSSPPTSKQSQSYDSTCRGGSSNQIGRRLARSTPSPPPPPLSRNEEKKTGDEKNPEGEQADHSNESSLHSGAAAEKVSREKAAAGQIAKKEGVQMTAMPKKEKAKEPKLTEEEIAAAGPGAFSVGLPSLSTGVFKFDAGKAAPIACQYADEHGPHDARLQFVSADITKMATTGNPCRYIVNPTNWRFLGRGGGTNQSVHTAAGPALEQTARERYKTAKTGVAYPVDLPEDSPLRVSEGVQCVINVVGPNMNPLRPDCLEGDYDKGEALLRQSYEAVLDCFLQLTRL